MVATMDGPLAELQAAMPQGIDQPVRAAGVEGPARGHHAERECAMLTALGAPSVPGRGVPRRGALADRAAPQPGRGHQGVHGRAAQSLLKSLAHAGALRTLAPHPCWPHWHAGALRMPPQGAAWTSPPWEGLRGWGALAGRAWECV